MYRPASSALIADFADETSPLLSERHWNDCQTPLKPPAAALGQDAAAAEKISTKVLAWVMTSVWIGTFCAGLGESNWRVFFFFNLFAMHLSVGFCFS